RFFAALRERGALIAFEPPRQRDLPGFIGQEARARGARMREPAARLLAELIGPDLGALAQAVERLALYAGPDRPIEEDDVAACVVDTRVRSVFDLLSAVAQGQTEQALRLTRRMIDERESPLGVVAMLARQFRQLTLVRELGARRASKADM